MYKRRNWDWLGIEDPDLPTQLLSMCEPDLTDDKGCQIWQGARKGNNNYEYGVIWVTGRPELTLEQAIRSRRR